MEILIGIIVIIALCLCLGVDISLIMGAVVALLSLTLGVITLFFVYCAVLLAGSKRHDAKFLRIGKNPAGKYDCAYYQIDGEEYPNYLPAEIVFRERFYPKNRSVKVWLCEKKHIVFDKNAFWAAAAGLLLGGISAAALAAYLIKAFL